MLNQKICCESGRVKVSYKIPTIKTFTNDTTLFRAHLRKSIVYSDEEALGLDDPEPYTGEVIISDSVTNVYGNTFPLTCLPNDSICVDTYLKAPFDLSFYVSSGGVDSKIGSSLNLSVSKDDYIGSNGLSYSIGGFVLPRSPFEAEARPDGSAYRYEPLVGGGDPPFLHKYSCEITSIVPFAYLDGDCKNPDRWEYFEVETSKLDLRYLKALFDLDKRTKVLSNFVVFRECVEIGVDVFNPSKINVAKYAENIDWSKVPLDPRDFTEYYKRDDIWFKNILTENIIKQIESPAGCPPPLVKLECCPETGCPEECPPDTCPVQCGDHICCYGKNGRSVKTIYV